MELFCTTLFTMSLAAALVAFGVMVVRFFLYKAPRALVCLLWLVVLFRMACPVSLSLPVSLVPQGVADGSAAQFVLTSSRPSSLNIPPVEASEATPAEPAPAPEEATNFTPPDTTNETAPAPAQEAGTPWTIFFALWLTGTAVGLVWGLVSYLRLRRRVAEAVRVTGNVYESDQIPSPFVLGIFRPKIYLTPALSPQEKHYVLLHERAHIRRGDCIVKPLAYLLLCFHWFNPVLWAAYRLLCLDLETACDQAVLRSLPQEDPEGTAGYAQALLHLSREPGTPAALPLAFGEEDAKARISLLLSYKRPPAWVLAAALVLCLLVGTVFAANPETDGVRVDWHRVSQGAMVCQGEEVPLPESLVRPLATLLEDTRRSAYVSCDDPGLPEGTILLSHPEDSGVSYRLFPPYLVQVRQQGEETTFRLAVLNGKYSDYHAIDGNTVYPRWISWYRAAEALTGDPPAQEVYALVPKDEEDLAGLKALLDALGVQELVGRTPSSARQSTTAARPWSCCPTRRPRPTAGSSRTWPSGASFSWPWCPSWIRRAGSSPTPAWACGWTGPACPGMGCLPAPWTSFPTSIPSGIWGGGTACPCPIMSVAPPPMSGCSGPLMTWRKCSIRARTSLATGWALPMSP